jgi:CDP-2,3-bis-(O-geranylgeranyl)-sn-glycerol synthase
MSWDGILRALWLFLPAYAANMAPVFVAKLFPSWNAPIDGGRVAADGRRILGPGKTWRGLAGGAVLGGLMALLLSVLAGVTPFVRDTDDFGRSAGASASNVFLFGAVLGAMALVGDAVKSYFKRRRAIERGGSWFPFDQLDFVVFGLAGVFLFAWLLPAGWVVAAFVSDWVVLFTLLVLTPVLHLLVNRIGYWLGLKEVPW